MLHATIEEEIQLTEDNWPWKVSDMQKSSDKWDPGKKLRAEKLLCQHDNLRYNYAMLDWS